METLQESPIASFGKILAHLGLVSGSIRDLLLSYNDLWNNTLVWSHKKPYFLQNKDKKVIKIFSRKLWLYAGKELRVFSREDK